MNNILRFAADSLFKTNYTRYEHSDLLLPAHPPVCSPQGQEWTIAPGLCLVRVCVGLVSYKQYREYK